MGYVLFPALTNTLDASPQRILGFPITRFLSYLLVGLGRGHCPQARFSLPAPFSSHSIQFQPTASFVCARVHCHLQEHGARSRKRLSGLKGLIFPAGISDGPTNSSLDGKGGAQRRARTGQQRRAALELRRPRAEVPVVQG